MIPILVDRASASSIECVDKITALFLLAAFLITDHMNLRACGSIPAEGSSSKTILGLPIRDMAVESFRLFPPLRV